jgi:rare lipoprotein A
VPGATLPHPNDRQKKDGPLEAQADEVWQPYVVPRRRLLFAVWLTVVALPILVIDNIPRTDARAATVHVSGREALAVPAAPSSTAASTTAAPAPETAVADAPATTTPKSKTTTPPTTRPKPVTVNAAAGAPTTTQAPDTTASSSEQYGGASWYDYNPGECAHQTLPKGTVVTVTRLATGASVTCVVTDRGPFGAGRVIDLDRGTFAQLADPGAGVIEVRLTW